MYMFVSIIPIDNPLYSQYNYHPQVVHQQAYAAAPLAYAQPIAKVAAPVYAQVAKVAAVQPE